MLILSEIYPIKKDVFRVKLYSIEYHIIFYNFKYIKK